MSPHRRRAINVQRDTGADSRNHCCRGEAICITYPECVFVALDIKHATRMRSVTVSSVASPALQHYLKDGVIIIFTHGLGRLTCSGIDALPSFPGASAIPSSPPFVGEGVFRESGVVHSFEVVDPVLFEFESHVLYSRDL